MKSNSNVFSLKMRATNNTDNSNESIDKKIIRMEKTNNKNYFSVEKIQVSMLVKDQQTHLVHKLAGEWTK